MDEAVTNLKKAVEMRPNYAAAYKYLGIVADKRDLTTEANSYFVKAIQCEKDSMKQSEIYYVLLNSQIENENFAGAITSAEHVLKVQPQNPKAWLMKAEAEYQLGRHQFAIISAEKGKIALNSSDPVKNAPYYFIIGLSSKYSGNLKNAREALTNALFGNCKYAAKNELDVLNGAIMR